MKKKLFLATMCLLLALTCLAGCVSHADQIAEIDKLLNVKYAKMDIAVTVSKDSDELTSQFSVEYGENDTSTITFNIQRFATISADGTAPDSFIEMYQGSATVKSGEVVSVNGDVPQDVKLESVSSRGMKFSESYFADVKATDGALTAKVTKPQAFLGQSDFDCKSDSMVVSVGYADVLQYVRIQYVSLNGAKVVLMYTFTV